MIFALYVFLILIMTITSSCSESTGISYIALIIPIFYLKKREYLLGLIFFSSAIFYRIPPGIPILPMLIVLYICSVMSERLYRKKWLINIKSITCFFLASLFLVYSCYTSISGSYGVLPITLLFISLVYFSVYDSSCNIPLLQRILLITSIIWIIFITYILLFNPYIYEEGRRTLSSFHNPNVIVRGVSFMSMVVFTSLFTSFKGLKFLLKVGVLLMSLFANFLTGGRMGIIAIIFAIAVCLYYGAKNRAQIMNYVFGAVAIGIVIIPIFSLIDVDFGRFEGAFTKEALKNDVRIVSAGILLDEAILEYPMTGVGLGNINSEQILDYVPDADNMYIDILTQLGIIGFVSITVLILSAFRRMKKILYQKKLPFKELALPMSFIILQVPFSLSETIFDELYIWYSIALTNIYINSINRYELTCINNSCKL